MIHGKTAQNQLPYCSIGIILFASGMTFGLVDLIFTAPQAIAQTTSTAAEGAADHDPIQFAELTALSQATRQDFLVSSDPGIQIFVREVLPANETDHVPVLLIHGGGPGGLASFDLDVPGYSLAEDFAKAGHPVYILDVRGWGRSTRPTSFNQPPEDSPPSVSSEEAVQDIGAVVDWIRARNQDQRVALLGWATGGHWAGMYTSQNNSKVSHLVMLNSLYGVDAPWELREVFEDPAHPDQFDPNAGDRLATAEGLVAKWNDVIPTEDLNEWRDPVVVKIYQQMALASDPTSHTRTPPSMRIPGAFRQESYNLSRGQQYWEAKAITVPTLVIRGERDYWSRPADLAVLKAGLVNAPVLETVTIPNGTHHLFLDRPERGRDRFLQIVLNFLAQPQGASAFCTGQSQWE